MFLFYMMQHFRKHMTQNHSSFGVLLNVLRSKQKNKNNPFTLSSESVLNMNICFTWESRFIYFSWIVYYLPLLILPYYFEKIPYDLHNKKNPEITRVKYLTYVLAWADHWNWNPELRYYFQYPLFASVLSVDVYFLLIIYYYQPYLCPIPCPH